MLAPALACLLAFGAAPPSPKVAAMPLRGGEGVPPDVVSALSEAWVAELRKAAPTPLVTSQDFAAVLGLERQRVLLGCEESVCFAEIAGALDVDEVVTGSVSRLGQSWLLQVQRLDARKGTALAHGSRRTRGGGADPEPLLDGLPSLARELFLTGSAGVDAGMGTTLAPGPRSLALSGPRVPAQPLQASAAEVPLSSPVDRSKLLVLTDGKGAVLALEPFRGLDGPFFAGDERALYLQRVFSGGSEGQVRFSLSFWEPRARVPAEASFELRDGRYTLTCGKREVVFTPVEKARARRLLAQAKLYDVRWQRRAFALARDDEGTHYYVDQPREPDEGSGGFRLYVGRVGRLEGEGAETLAHDAQGTLLESSRGRLKLSFDKGLAEWLQGEKRTALTFLPVEDHARFIYTGLGVYAGQALGTPCDGRFEAAVR